MPDLTLDQNDSPLVVVELIHRLKVRMVMNDELLCLSRVDSMRRAQERMKTHERRMLPVAEQGRLYGVISMGNILEALESRTIHEPCGLHMRDHVVSLEADMPLSFAINYFDRFGFQAFPVLDRQRCLVGTLSMREVNRSLLRELSRELQRLEASQAGGDPASALPEYALHEFQVKREDFSHAGNASNTLRRELMRRGVERGLIRRVSVAAYELEMNLVLHSWGGTLSCMLGAQTAEITARDPGPGIDNVAWALRDGTTTASESIRALGFGAGMGLPNARKVSDEFDIRSAAGRGTVVRAVIRIPREDLPPSAHRPARQPEDEKGKGTAG